MNMTTKLRSTIYNKSLITNTLESLLIMSIPPAINHGSNLEPIQSPMMSIKPMHTMTHNSNIDIQSFLFMRSMLTQFTLKNTMMIKITSKVHIRIKSLRESIQSMKKVSITT